MTLSLTKSNQAGLLLCSRYALPPNWLKYCGGDNPKEILAYSAEKVADLGLVELLKEFNTMHPYLKLIAEANKISDPFAASVVEAYWLGNKLLTKVSQNSLYNFLRDDLQLNKKIKNNLWNEITDKINLRPWPHHSWHVFNVFIRTGHFTLEHTLETMDNCKISWGQVVADNGDSFSVSTQPLALIDGELDFGLTTIKKIFKAQPEKNLSLEVKVGDYVSFHWNWFCDKLTLKQLQYLKKITADNLAIANLTI
ncbi:MAG: DUF6390 family protein [Candidatus Buchananbacteria bacterium]